MKDFGHYQRSGSNCQQWLYGPKLGKQNKNPDNWRVKGPFIRPCNLKLGKESLWRMSSERQWDMIPWRQPCQLSPRETGLDGRRLVHPASSKKSILLLWHTWFKKQNHWRECGEMGTLLHCWWECKLVKPLWRTVPIFLEKLKTELPYDTVIPPLGIHSEKTIIPKDTHTSVFTEALFTIVPEYGSNLNFHQQRAG